MAFDSGAIEASLTLDRTRFSQGIRDATAEARRFADGTYRARVTVDDRDARASIDAIRQALRGLPNQVGIRVNISGLGAISTTEINDITAELDQLKAIGDINLRATLALTGFEPERLASLRSAREDLERLAAVGTIHVGAVLDLPTDEQLARLRVIRDELDQLHNRDILVRIRTDNSSTGTPGGGGGGGGGVAAGGGQGGLAAFGIPFLISLTPALIPLAGALTGVAGALGAMAAAAGIGFAGIAILAKENTKALTTQFGAVKAAAGEVSRVLGPEFLAISGPALQTVADLVRAIAPATKFALDAVGGLVKQFSASVHGGGVSQFIAGMTQLTGPAITGFGRILGGIATGVGHFLLSFAPLTSVVLPAIIRVTDAFAKFNFGPLVDYAKANLPALGNFITGIAGTVKAILVDLAPLGGVVLHAVIGIVGALKDAVPGIAAFANAVAAPAIRGLAPILEGAVRGIGDLASELSHLGGFLSPVLTEILAVVLAIKAVTLAATAAKAIGTAFTGIRTGVLAARQALVLMTYSSSGVVSAFGRIASSSVAFGIAGVAVAALAVGVGLLIKHYEDGKPKIDSFTSALQASNGQIDQGVRAQAAANLQQNGALDAARKLGLALPLVTSAALHQADGLAAVNAIGRKVTDAYNNLATANEQLRKSGATEAEIQAHSAAITKQYDAYNQLVKILGANQGTFNNDLHSQQNIAAATAKAAAATNSQVDAQKAVHAQFVLGQIAQAQLTRDVTAYHTAMTSLNSTLTGIVDRFYGVKGAEDALATDIINLTAQIKANHAGFVANTAGAIANRAAITGMATDYGNLVQKVSTSGESLAQQNKELSTSRESLIKHAEALGLQGPALQTFIDVLQKEGKQNPNLTFHAKIAQDKAFQDAVAHGYTSTLSFITSIKNNNAELAQAHRDAQASVAKAPITANVAFVAQGVNERTQDALRLDRLYAQTTKTRSTTFTAPGLIPRTTDVNNYNLALGKTPSGKATAITAPGIASTTQGVVWLNANGYGKIPGSKQTSISAPGLASTTSAVQTFHQNLDALPNKTVTITLNAGDTYAKLSALAKLSGNYATAAQTNKNQKQLPPGAASGGRINGPGGPREDAIPTMLSNGEYVINAHAASRYAALLEAINTSTRGFANGGPVWTEVLNDSPLSALLKQKQAASNPINFHGSAGVTQWAPLILQVLSMLGLSPGLLGVVETQMNTESGGNPNAINLTDSNAQAGDPSRGLMQVIGTTFAAYRSPGLSGNIYDPLANIYAGLHYAETRYGKNLSYLGHGHGYAEGGSVLGAGGPMDDTILARLSNGEYVVNAKAAMKNRGILDAINGYAAGGAVGGQPPYNPLDPNGYKQVVKAIEALPKALQGVFANLQKETSRGGNFVQNLIGGNSAASTAVQADYVTIIGQVNTDYANLAKNVASTEKALKSLGKETPKNKAQFEALTKQLKELNAITPGSRNTLLDTLKADNAKLHVLAIDRDHALATLAKAQTNYQAAVAARSQDASSFTGALTGGVSLAGVYGDAQTANQNAAAARDAQSGAPAGTTAAAPVTGGQILAGLRAKLAGVKTFAADLAKLAKLGLNKDMIREIATAGVAALPEVQALLADPRDLKAINDAQAGIDAVSAASGASSAGTLDNGSVMTALLAQTKDQDAVNALTKQMTQIGREMNNAIRRGLGEDPIDFGGGGKKGIPFHPVRDPIGVLKALPDKKARVSSSGAIKVSLEGEGLALMLDDGTILDAHIVKVAARTMHAQARAKVRSR